MSSVLSYTRETKERLFEKGFNQETINELQKHYSEDVMLKGLKVLSQHEKEKPIHNKLSYLSSCLRNIKEEVSKQKNGTHSHAPQPKEIKTPQITPTKGCSNKNPLPIELQVIITEYQIHRGFIYKEDEIAQLAEQFKARLLSCYRNGVHPDQVSLYNSELAWYFKKFVGL